ncbi:MAG: hypothetical protein R3F43_25830 [bacterium]
MQIDPRAWAVYHRACPGSGAEARSDRGSLDLTLLFEGTAINPVIWGGMKSCLLGAALRLDGEVRFYVPNLTQGLTRLIVDFAGQLSQDGDPWTQVAFDALITPGEGVLTTVDVEGRGRFLVGYGFGTSGVQVVDAQEPGGAARTPAPAPTGRGCRGDRPRCCWRSSVRKPPAAARHDEKTPPPTTPSTRSMRGSGAWASSPWSWACVTTCRSAPTPSSGC